LFSNMDGRQSRWFCEDRRYLANNCSLTESPINQI
jgi:hypothetical protein